MGEGSFPRIMTGTGSSLAPLVVTLAGLPVTACLPTKASEEVIRLATSDRTRGADIHLCNAYTLALADKDPAFHEVLERATHNFPDGQPLVWASRMLHPRADLPAVRVYGPDLFLDVIDLGRPVGLRHFLLGSTPTVLERLTSELMARFPGAIIVGALSPPFRELTEHDLDEQVALLTASGAHVIWLGLGTPKQDWVASLLASRLPAVFCAVGAAFDFVAGTKSQAPRWMQQRGLEWVYRLATEPRRLWKRYLFGNVRFIKAVIMSR